MTHQQILERAIQEAAGYNPNTPHFAHPLEEYEWVDADKSWHHGDDRIGLYEIIYQHSFAKALWGESPHDLFIIGKEGNGNFTSVNHPMPSWAYYLQHMVTANDPIKYLGENMLE